MYQRKVEYPDCINQKITEKGTVTITSGKVSIPKFFWIIDLFLTFLEHLKLMISAKDCKVESGGFYAFTLEIDCKKKQRLLHWFPTDPLPVVDFEKNNSLLWERMFREIM